MKFAQTISQGPPGLELLRSPRWIQGTLAIESAPNSGIAIEGTGQDPGAFAAGTGVFLRINILKHVVLWLVVLQWSTGWWFQLL